MIYQTNSETLKPPASSAGMIGWMRQNLFSSPFNSFLTIIVLIAMYRIIPPLFKWAVLNSRWFSTSAECRASGGACWSVITENLRFIIFGLYPREHHWRPLTAMIILVLLLLYSKERSRWNKHILWIWPLSMTIMGILMQGGIFGLESVESTKWSGLPLTMMLSVFGMFSAYPLGIVLALGRRSRMPAIKSLCIVYIEIIRGVPFISMLFMSAIMFPLFLPEGITVNKILRAQTAIIMFTAAYIAEVVRGGLQAIPKGQYEAADSLGLNYYYKMRLVILPQALKIVIPPTVGILISAFKDTSLVVIIALYDVMKTTNVTLSNPLWNGFSAEAYLFLSLLYLICCYAMSDYSRRLERELHS